MRAGQGGAQSGAGDDAAQYARNPEYSERGAAEDGRHSGDGGGGKPAPDRPSATAHVAGSAHAASMQLTISITRAGIMPVCIASIAQARSGAHDPRRGARLGSLSPRWRAAGDQIRGGERCSS